MAKVAANESAGAYVKRSLTGTTFLALEHTLHKVVLIVVAGLVAVGLTNGLNMWLGNQANSSMVESWLSNPLLAQMNGMSALMLVAALVVFAPWLVVLDRRVKAEMAKRHGFERRVAYKLPLYGAMGVVALIMLGIKVTAVWVVLYSLATMGQVSAESVGQLYRDQFVPAFVALVVFGTVGWYLLRTAQGKAAGQLFNGLLTVMALVLAVALFITAMVDVQSSKSTLESTPSLEDYLQEYKNGTDNLDNFNY